MSNYNMLSYKNIVDLLNMIIATRFNVKYEAIHFSVETKEDHSISGKLIVDGESPLKGQAFVLNTKDRPGINNTVEAVAAAFVLMFADDKWAYPESLETELSRIHGENKVPKWRGEIK